MRMDNETFRLKVENLLANAKGEDGAYDRSVMAELEQMAATPRKVRYFLKAVSSHDDETLQVHFYRYVMARVKSQHDVSDLERHIRHMYYEDRERAKAILARVMRADVIAAMLRVISFTEEGWLAGELIRIVLQAPVEELYQPVVDALNSPDYLLQCLAIYLVGKSGKERLLDALVAFYRRPFGEKPERLERKALDALMEGTRSAPVALIVKWLKDKSSRVRELALRIAQERKLAETAGDVAGLVLIDAKTRAMAAQTLLQFESDGVLRLLPEDETARPVLDLIRGAKQEAVQNTLVSLMRDESQAVREVAIRLALFLTEPDSVSGPIRRAATEDRISSVQIAAMRVLADINPEKLVPVLVEVFTDGASAGGSRDVLEVASELMSRTLDANQVRTVEEGIKAKEERRDAALDRFSGNVEWWRHDI